MDPCLQCLEELVFEICSFGPHGMPALAELLERDAFPSLKRLSLINCPEVGDDGVVRLAQALLTSPRTRLTELWLEYVNMGDLGMAALANLVRQERCGKLTKMKFSDSHITDEGVLAMAEAFGQGPILDNLKRFEIGRLGDIRMAVLRSWPLLF